MLLRTSTRAASEVVLCCDPAIQRENNDDARAAYRASGQPLKVPDDALRVFVRPLSLDERMQVDDAGDGVRLQMADDRPAGQDARTALLRLHRRRALATVRLGVVRASEGGVELEGGEALLEALPDALFYQVVAELAETIRGLSRLADPKG